MWLFVVVVKSPSHVQLFVTTWTAACQASTSLTISWSLSKFKSVASVMPSSHLILWCLRLLLSSIFPQHRGLFQSVSCLHQMTKYWSFSFSISPSKEYSGLISLKTDWFDLAVQGTLRSLLQHHSLKAAILWCSTYFMPLVLTTVPSHWEDHCFDYMDVCQQSNVSAFQHAL